MGWGPLGSPERKEGCAIHIYTASASMDACCLGNADGDLLIVPQQGAHQGLVNGLTAWLVQVASMHACNTQSGQAPC